MHRTHSVQLFLCVIMNFRPSEAKTDKTEKVHRATGVGWCEASPWQAWKPSLNRDNWVRDQLSASPGADSQNCTQAIGCAPPKGCGVMETLPSCYTGGVTHTLCSLILDCAMRGSGEVISKVFCLLHAVEELTSNFSLFVLSSIFLPGVCSGVGVLSQLWDKHFSSHRKRSTLNDIPLFPPPQAVLNRIRIQLVASLQPIFILYGFARCKRMLANSLSERNSSEAGVPSADAFGQYSSSHPRNACWPWRLVIGQWKGVCSPCSPLHLPGPS